MDVKTIENNHIANDPVAQISEREFDIALLKFGSYLSMLQNKRLNQAFVLLSIVQNLSLRKVFMEIAEIDNFQTLMTEFLLRYPSLCKSKVLKRKIERITNVNTARRRSLQHVSSYNS